MAEFMQSTITQKGVALARKTQHGNIKIEFTKLGTGAGIYAEGEELGLITALRDKKQEFVFSSFSVSDPTTVKLTSVISNKNLTEGYYIREIGIYANDPDEGEILYALTVAKDGRADFLPAFDGLAPVTIGLDSYIAVLSAENAEITVDPGAYASAADLLELEERVDKKSYITVLSASESLPATAEPDTWYLKKTTTADDAEKLLVELYDAYGNKYYLHTDASVVYCSDGETVESKLAKKIDKTAIVQNASTNATDKIVSAAVAKVLQDQITEQNTKKVRYSFLSFSDGSYLFAEVGVEKTLNLPIQNYSVIFVKIGLSKNGEAATNTGYMETTLTFCDFSGRHVDTEGFCIVTSESWKCWGGISVNFVTGDIKYQMNGCVGWDPTKFTIKRVYGLITS